MEGRDRIEIERKETKGNRVKYLKRGVRNIDTCLCLSFSFPQGTVFLLSIQLDSTVKLCSSVVLVSSGAARKRYGLKRLEKY